jgi:hypothetical protein
MAHPSTLLFAITAALAPQAGLAVSLKFTEDHTAMSVSSSAWNWVDDASGHRATVHNDTALKSFIGSLIEPVEEESKLALPVFNPDLVLGDILGKFNDSIESFSIATSSVDKQLESFLTEFAKDSNRSWGMYVDLLPEALSKIQTAPFFKSLENMTDKAVPDTMPVLSQALDEYAICFEYLRNATLMAKALPRDNVTYSEAEGYVESIKEAMRHFLNDGKVGADALDQVFAQLLYTMAENPLLLQIPDVLASPFLKIIGKAKRVSRQVRDDMGGMFDKVNQIVGDASNDALLNLKQELVPPQSGASRVAPLLAAMLAVGAAAFP